MKKIYSIDYSSESYICNRNSNILVISYRFVILLSLFISSIYYAQDNTITGFENMKVSKGAIMITKNTEEKTLTLTKESSVEIIASKTEIKKNIVQNSESDSKKNLIEKKKIARKSETKTYKNIKVKENTVFVFNKNKKPEEYLSLSSITSKVGFHTPTYSSGKFINSDSNFDYYLFIYQTKENSLINYYESKKVESFLFARPPPFM